MELVKQPKNDTPLFCQTGSYHLARFKKSVNKSSKLTGFRCYKRVGFK